MKPERILKMEILPYSLHHVNIRNEMGTYKWGKMAREIKEKANWLCSICGKDMSSEHKKLQLHEKWVFDEEMLEARIEKFIPICNLCHAWKHIGFMLIQIEKGWLTREQVEQHYIETNKITIDELVYDKHKLAKWWKVNADKRYVLVIKTKNMIKQQILNPNIAYEEQKI
jgi:hypothetical protein